MISSRKILVVLFSILFLSGFSIENFSQTKTVKTSKHKWLLLKQQDISPEAQNLNHLKNFKKYAKGYNLAVLRAIDSVQAHAMNGGGYFIGKDSTPTESPIGYELKLFGNPLINPPRTTSYCSGSSYTTLMTSLNYILPKGGKKISKERLEAVRMQEPNGGRREDWIKFWGIWNADGFGSQYALVQYSKMGKNIKPVDAMPGDFMNISWKTGIGHSVVFLGWYIDKEGNKNVVYWSSQKGTNGMGDQVVPLSRIKEVKIVRLTNPQNLFKFNINQPVDKKVPGDEIGL
ncbi:MAG: hypothetical protein M1480_10615 [Bacteroidetes bacterium]|nr:hypothetical protein [Bacteroidota bacterium]